MERRRTAVREALDSAEVALRLGAPVRSLEHLNRAVVEIARCPATDGLDDTERFKSVFRSAILSGFQSHVARGGVWTVDDTQWFSTLLAGLEKLESLGHAPSVTWAYAQYVSLLAPLLTQSNMYVRLDYEQFYLCRLTRNILLPDAPTRLHHRSQLGPPPDEAARLARANLPGRAVLYASNMDIGPVAEVKPLPGEVVTHARWRIRPGSHADALLIVPNTDWYRSLYPVQFERQD